MIHPTAIVHDNVTLGPGTTVEPFCLLGSDNPDEQVTVGANSLIRAYSRLQGNVSTGSHFETGNHVLVKGTDVKIGTDVRIGSYSSVEGPVARIGDHVRIYGRAEMSCATVGNHARMYLGSVLSDTRKPPEGPIEPPTLEDGAIVYIYGLVMAGVTVGRGARIAACAVALQDVPVGHLLQRDGSLRLL